jgi:uncharacterized membrane protein YgcG
MPQQQKKTALDYLLETTQQFKLIFRRHLYVLIAGLTIVAAIVLSSQVVTAAPPNGIKTYSDITYNGRTYDAKVDAGNHTVTLIKRISIDIGGGWGNRSDTAATIAKFKQDFAQGVQAAWGGKYSFQSDCLGNQPFRTNVEVQFTNTNPHSEIGIFPNSTDPDATSKEGALQESDNNPKSRERLFLPNPNKPSSSSNAPFKKTFTQTTSIKHSNSGGPGCKIDPAYVLPPEKQRPSPPKCYGEGVSPDLADDVMGIGSYVSPQDYAPFDAIMDRYAQDAAAGGTCDPKKPVKWKKAPDNYTPPGKSGNGSNGNGSNGSNGNSSGNGSGSNGNGTDPGSGGDPKDRKQGRSYGDPHLISFDDFRYSFQTVGEFILAQSADGKFIVQTRQGRVPNQQLSLNTAVAIQTGDDRISLYSQDFPDSDQTSIWINNQPTQLKEGTFELPGGGVVQRNDQDYVVQAKTGELVTVRHTSQGDRAFMNVTVDVPNSREYMGLLGNKDGNPTNDLITRQGRVIPTESSYGKITQALGNLLPIPVPVSTLEQAFLAKLHRDFGDSWRISQAESLFNYASGKTTDSFSDRNFPSQYSTISSLMPKQIQAAEQVCRQAGVTDVTLEGCILDVGLTGQSEFASAAVGVLEKLVLNKVQSRLQQELQNRIPIPTPRICLPFVGCR